ncbi:hypothetical protein C7974DRAFT_378316 [Boeremia exigua]|uniref:uncharacterized protein n=1 Tax=Boeremia exigua TaxID=749465 RepID=UPI001E8EE282|nr:uncharacterized protein C7974DRAFT_378316 [Boeremia exigua]KAH6620227.1 hypothetical protein C7974DRAFT_378316 [Boeremia exigua]
MRLGETFGSGRISASTSPKSQKSITKIVYIVIDTCFATLTDFDQGKGSTSIDSVHTTSHVANIRAKKIMFARINLNNTCQVDKDKILEEIKDGLYTGIGIGGDENTGCYARKCEVEAKPVDIEDDGSSEEDHDGEDWSMG